jgi:peptidoglycan/LPS O-acetylase OafA/YrhL
LKTSVGRIEQIDVLRGIAALVVLLFHYGTRYNAMFPEKSGWMPLNIFWGSYGVHLFFIVSGFVIFMTLERSQTRMDFIISRISRLYPVYWAAVLFTIVFDLAFPDLGFTPHPVQIAINMTMLHDFVRVDAVDGSYWSLTFELGFYAFMLFMFGRKFLKRPAIIAVFWSVASILFHYWPGFFPGGLHYIAVTHKYGHLFATGVAFYWLYSRGVSKSFHDLCLIAVILAAPAVQYLHSGMIGFWAVLASIVLMTAATRHWLSWITNPVTLWLGSISYPLYLIHEHAGWHLLSLQQHYGVNAYAALVFTVSFMLIVATLLSKLIEKPAQRAIRDYYRKYLASVAPLPARS